MSEEKTTVENNGQQEAEDLKELLQIRRDKLSALQEAGQDPFEITVCHPDIHAADIIERFEELENQDVSACQTACNKRSYASGVLMR